MDTPRPDVRAARSWLFVPGDRPDRFGKAMASGADVVVLDLEDAVAEDAKATARAEVTGWLTRGGAACVRVNAPGTPFADPDVAALAGLPGVVAVMVPKAEDPRVLAGLAEAVGPGTAVVALVETALGMYRVHELAATPGVARLAFGSIDLALDLGAEDAAVPLLCARSALVLASRVAGLPAPVDGVTPVLDDPAVVQEAAATAAGLGFGGKLCVHPRQVDAVHTGFRPSEAKVRHARRVLASVTEGVGQVDGQMVDTPVVERARQVLRRSGDLDEGGLDGDPGPAPHDTRSA
jgi:citrate lyase subunit beta/citryl-CoA lyase